MALKKRLKISECLASDPVFIGIRGGRLGRGGIHYRMKFWVRISGLSEKLSYHSLRHGFATRMLNQGIKLHDLKEVMGHQNIATTSLYLHFTEESREAFRRLL
jgi:integrase/recombinase XerC